MTMAQGIMTNGNIRLGDFEMIMDFFSNPEEYEPDLSEVKIAINDKKPVEIVRKPVIKPKITREGLINKYSLVNTQKEVTSDNILADDLVINEIDDFDFGDMDFEIEEEKPKSESQSDTKEIKHKETESVNGIEIDIDIEDEDEEDNIEDEKIEFDLDDIDDLDFEDDEIDDKPALVESKPNQNTKNHEVVNGIEFDFDDDFDDDEDTDGAEEVPRQTSQVTTNPVEKSKANEVINGIEFDFDDDFDDDDFEDDDSSSNITNISNRVENKSIEIDNKSTKVVNKPAEKEEVNGIEFDIDIDDFEDDDDAEIQTNDKVIQQSVQKPVQSNVVSSAPKQSINSNKETKNNNLLDEIDDSDLEDLFDADDDFEEIQPEQKKVVNQGTRDSENERLLAELNRLKAENDKLKRESEKSKSNQPEIVKAAVNKQTNEVKKKNDIVDTICEPGARKAKELKAEEVTGSKYDKYTVMNINALYANVSRYMISKGVRHKPIDINELNEKFGTDNIKKLIVKQYLIKTKKGVTVGL